MKRIVMSALILLIVASSVSVAVTQGDKAGLEKTVNTFFDAVKANNVDTIKTYYTADYTFTNPEGKIMGVEERLKMLKAGGTTFLGTSDVSVRVYGSTGVATGIATTKNSAGATGQSRFLQAWTWEQGQWRLAASQATPIK